MQSIIESLLPDISSYNRYNYSGYCAGDKCIYNLPGFNKNNLEVTMKGYVINIKGDNGIWKIDKNIRVSSHVDKKQVKAELEDGVLTIHLTPKEEEIIKLL